MHKMEIPWHIVERIKARRGKFSIYETVVAQQTALLVIDLQNAFMLPDMPSYLPGGVEIVPNVNQLAAALRAKGGMVVWTKHTYDPAWTVYNDFSGPGHLQAVREAYKAGAMSVTNFTRVLQSMLLTLSLRSGALAPLFMDRLILKADCGPVTSTR